MVFFQTPAPSRSSAPFASRQRGPPNEAGSLPSARDQASNLENADTTASNEKMTSSRALVALAVALLAASTGKVPLLSPPVKAVLSFVLPASLGGGSGGAFSSDVAGDDGSTSHLRANRLLSIALRNATSDYDEVRMLALLERKQSKGQRRGFVASARGGIPPPFPPLAPPGKNFKMASDNKLIFFFFPPPLPHIHTRNPARLHRLRMVQVARTRRGGRGGVHRVSEIQGEKVKKKSWRERERELISTSPVVVLLDYSRSLLVWGRTEGARHLDSASRSILVHLQTP